MKSRISDAIAHVDNLDNDVDLEVFNYTGYGKEFMKSCRCSPDAWLQMSLQLTMFRLTGELLQHMRVLLQEDSDLEELIA